MKESERRSGDLCKMRWPEKATPRKLTSKPSQEEWAGTGYVTEREEGSKQRKGPGRRPGQERGRGEQGGRLQMTLERHGVGGRRPLKNVGLQAQQEAKDGFSAEATRGSHAIHPHNWLLLFSHRALSGIRSFAGKLLPTKVSLAVKVSLCYPSREQKCAFYATPRKRGNLMTELWAFIEIVFLNTGCNPKGEKLGKGNVETYQSLFNSSFVFIFINQHMT